MGKDLVGWDITIPFGEHGYTDYREVAKKLKGWCQKWAFQMEVGEETGYKHFQCRVWLFKAKTPGMVIKQVAPEVKGHWSITCNKVHHGNNFNYVMKEDSRVAGPWTDQDEEFEDPPVMTKQLEHFLSLPRRGWQERMEEIIAVFDMRCINIIYDQIGNSGKSLFSEYLEYTKQAFEVPALRSFEDIMQFTYSFKNQKAYLIDMPRGMKKDKLSEFYSGIESLKNGVVWDKRYAGKKRRMDRPNIIVFTNTLPDFELLSADRWVVWEMQPDYTLARHDILQRYGVDTAD